MESFINIHELVTDGSVWLAIIAINMTVIGLTSLAESKSVIGIDYGKYLIKSYIILGKLRIYHLLAIFASVNIISLFSMFIEIYFVRVANFIVLILSLVFAIYYFFAYILIENPRVRKQIYLSELSGIYYKSEDITNFKADLLTEMKNGWRTRKRLSTNVISYFNNFSSESQDAFSEIFGPRSIIYSESKSIKNYWKRKYGKEPFDYSSKLGGVHISHEFFQMYRYSELQEKWLLEILALFNKEYSAENQSSRLDDLIRVIAHVNQFGVCENLFKYKFLEYLAPYIYEAIIIENLGNERNRQKKEEFMYSELFKYILNTTDSYNDSTFSRTAVDLCCRLIGHAEYNVNLNSTEKIKILAHEFEIFHGENVKNMISEIANYYLSNCSYSNFGVEEISRIIDFKNQEVGSVYEVKTKIFSS